MASSKTSLLDEMLVSLLLMFSGIFLSSAGGWLLSRWTYNNLLLGTGQKVQGGGGDGPEHFEMWWLENT